MVAMYTEYNPSPDDLLILSGLGMLYFKLLPCLCGRCIRIYQNIMYSTVV